jgi:protein-S-isoprenylcysteine O-methyltransferase Ste14
VAGSAQRRLPLWLRTTLFTLCLPGAVLVYLPAVLLWSCGDGLALPLGALRHGGWPLMALGVAGYLLCAVRFGREGDGTPAPWDAPVGLVGGGLYRKTRNPMYVAMLLALLGEALLFANGSLLLHALIMAVVFHLRVTGGEEPLLRARFGSAYADYCRRVPRWLLRWPRA